MRLPLITVILMMATSTTNALWPLTDDYVSFTPKGAGMESGTGVLSLEESGDETEPESQCLCRKELNILRNILGVLFNDTHQHNPFGDLGKKLDALSQRLDAIETKAAEKTQDPVLEKLDELVNTVESQANVLDQLTVNVSLTEDAAIKRNDKLMDSVTSLSMRLSEHGNAMSQSFIDLGDQMAELHVQTSNVGSNTSNGFVNLNRNVVNLGEVINRRDSSISRNRQHLEELKRLVTDSTEAIVETVDDKADETVELINSFSDSVKKTFSGLDTHFQQLNDHVTSLSDKLSEDFVSVKASNVTSGDKPMCSIPKVQCVDEETVSALLDKHFHDAEQTHDTTYEHFEDLLNATRDEFYLECVTSKTDIINQLNELKQAVEDVQFSPNFETPVDLEPRDSQPAYTGRKLQSLENKFNVHLKDFNKFEMDMFGFKRKFNSHVQTTSKLSRNLASTEKKVAQLETGHNNTIYELDRIKRDVTMHSEYIQQHERDYTALMAQLKANLTNLEQYLDFLRTSLLGINSTQATQDKQIGGLAYRLVRLDETLSQLQSEMQNNSKLIRELRKMRKSVKSAWPNFRRTSNVISEINEADPKVLDEVGKMINSVSDKLKKLDRKMRKVKRAQQTQRVTVENSIADVKRANDMHIKELRTEIDGINFGNGNAESSSVFFSATVGTDAVIPAKGTIIFGTTTSNRGGAYDPTSGIFVSPVSGYYSFHVTLVSDYYERVFAALVVGGKDKMFIHAGGSNYQGSGSNTIILHLTRGEEAYVRIKRTVVGNSNFLPQLFSTFTGYLLK